MPGRNILGNCIITLDDTFSGFKGNGPLTVMTFLSSGSSECTSIDVHGDPISVGGPGWSASAISNLEVMDPPYDLPLGPPFDADHTQPQPPETFMYLGKCCAGCPYQIRQGESLKEIEVLQGTGICDSMPPPPGSFILFGATVFYDTDAEECRVKVEVQTRALAGAFGDILSEFIFSLTGGSQTEVIHVDGFFEGFPFHGIVNHTVILS